VEILCIGFHGLGLLHKISTPLSILVSGMRTLYYNFYLKLSCYIPLIDPGLWCLYSYTYTDMCSSRVDAEYNTYTVALRVVGGHETESLESETAKYGCESHGTRTCE
jgi:hypothetical protein